MDDVRLGHVDERRVDVELPALDARLGRQVGQSLEGEDELRTAIWIAGVMCEDAVGDKVLSPLDGKVVHEKRAGFLDLDDTLKRQSGAEKRTKLLHSGKRRALSAKSHVILAAVVVDPGFFPWRESCTRDS